MAKIINAKTGESRGVEKGASIKKACEELGVPISCSNGCCGSCMIIVRKGRELLNPLTDEEKALERTKKKRLACQCKIKKGEVSIEF
jgi:ferredoxin